MCLCNSDHLSSSEAVPEGDHSLRDIASHGSHLSLPQHTSQDPHYDEDLKLEVLRAIAALHPAPGETRINAITRLLNTTIQPDTKGMHPRLSHATP